MAVDPLDCDNIFDDLEIVLTDKHLDIDTVCVQALRDLATRDDWLEQVTILIEAQLIIICDKVNILEATIDPCLYNCLYPCAPFYLYCEAEKVLIMPTASTDAGVKGQWAEDTFYLAHHDGTQWWFIPKVTI